MADWRLLDYAKEAEDVASGLSVFIGEIPQFSKEITGNIAELFAISSALRTLHEDLDLKRYGRRSGVILRDLDICLPSLSYTLSDVSSMFGESRRKKKKVHPGAFPDTPPLARIWEDTCSDLAIQGIGLGTRLSMYRTFLQGMSDALKGAEEDYDVEDARIRLGKLIKKQEPIDDYMSRLDMASRAHARTPQPHHQHPPPASRPHYDRHSTYPTNAIHNAANAIHNAIHNAYNHVVPPPLPPRSPAPPPVAQRPHYERYTTYPGYGTHGPPPPPPPAPAPPPPAQASYPHAYGIGDMPFMPPMAPDVPHSPTISSASSQTHSTHSSDSGGPVAHWAMRIFDGRHSSTPFGNLGQPTKCLGRDEPKAIERLDVDGFLKVLELPFEATNVWIRLYWRAEDNRARILFLTLDPNGRRMRHCFPLTGLKFLRTESCLQLCRVNRQDGQLDLWANLRFTLYERMVLLYCTMTAMKRQDNVTTAAGLEDYFQPGEKEEFGGEIRDAGYLHAFRIFRDRDSGCVRFEATPRRGPLKTIPIWTAFVTQYIGERGWMKRISQCTVQFRELHPYMFCDGYRLGRGKSGRYLLNFTTAQDTKAFMDIFHRIRTH